jgi:hypothetical protein
MMSKNDSACATVALVAIWRMSLVEEVDVSPQPNEPSCLVYAKLDRRRLFVCVSAVIHCAEARQTTVFDDGELCCPTSTPVGWELSR